MKLATISYQGRTAIAVIKDGGVIDLGYIDPSLNVSMVSFLELGQAAMDRAREIAEAETPRLELEQVTLEAPVQRPGKFLALGMNYARHVKEAEKMGIKPPERQVWFNKQITCINAPYAGIQLPKVSTKIDYEVELAFVIGTRCRHVKKQDAHKVIAAYTICNDVSVRDWQMHSPTMTMGKSFDTHGPLGPWLVTPDEIGDPHNLRLQCHVNGEQRQDSNTSDMIYSCFDMIAYLSQAFTLEPGDVISTGTPEGIGATMEPPGFLKPGDVVRCEVEKIGFIEGKMVAE